MKLCLFALTPILATALTPSAGVDLGNEYAKFAVTSPRHKMEIILNQQSGRKTRTAVKLSPGATRQFGQSAYNAQGQKPEEVLQYFADLEWDLPEAYYPHENVSADQPFLHYMAYLKDILETTVVRADSVLEFHDTPLASQIPVGTGYRQRQRRAQLIDLLGFRPSGLLPAPMLAALSNAVDLSPNLKAGAPRRKLYLDFGAKYLQACLVDIENVTTTNETRLAAGARAGPLTTRIRKIFCDRSPTMGAHSIDLLLADHIIAKFAPKLDEEAESPARVRRSILKLATGAKHTLSVAPQARVAYENLFSGRDLSETVTRDELEKMVSESDWLKGVERTVTAWSKLPYDEVELIGNGWRVPKLLELLKKWLGAKKVSMKCNADEAVVVGANILATNSSAVYKFKPTYFEYPAEESFQVRLLLPEAAAAADTFEPFGEPLKIGAGELYGSTKTVRYQAVNMTARGDAVRAVVETGDGQQLYHTIKLSGLDTVRRMRKRSYQLYLDKKQRFEDLKASNFTTSVQDSKNRTVTVAVPQPSEWSEPTLAPNAAELDLYNLTLKTTINYNGLLKISSAFVSWLEPHVDEITQTHNVDLPKIEPASEEAAPEVEEAAEGGKGDRISEATNTTNSTTTANITVSDKADEPVEPPTELPASGEETTMKTEEKPEKALVTSYVWTVKHDAKRKRSLSVYEMDLTVREGEEARFVQPMPLTRRELSKLKSGLQDWLKLDEQAERLNELRNSFESLIYRLKDTLRSWIDEQVLEVADSEPALKSLSEAERWLLEEEGATTVELKAIQEKQADLVALESKMRATVATHPKTIEKEVRSELARARGKAKRVKNPDTSVLKSIITELDEFEAWLTAQAGTPIVTSDELGGDNKTSAIRTRWQEVQKLFQAKISSLKKTTSTSSSTSTSTSTPKAEKEEQRVEL